MKMKANVIVIQYIHCVSKNDTDVAHCSLDGDQLILIIFGRDVADEYAIKRWFVIPPLLTNVSALPGETWTPEIVFSVMLNEWVCRFNVPLDTQ